MKLLLALLTLLFAFPSTSYSHDENPPLSAPVSDTSIRNWASEAVSETMTFGFHDYRMRLQKSSRLFTTQGWKSFTEALERSDTITTLASEQQLITTAIRGAPYILQSQLVGDRYEWDVQVPVIVSYQQGTKIRSDKLLTTLRIVRTIGTGPEDTVAIQKWAMKPDQ